MTIGNEYQAHDAIIESIALRRRKEEGARMHVVVSIPVRPHPEMLSELASQIGNAITVGFDFMQARAPYAVADPEDEDADPEEDEVSPAAQALIDDSRVEVPEDQRAEGEAKLAARSRNGSS